MSRHSMFCRLAAAGMAVVFSFIAVLKTTAGRQVSSPPSLGREIQIKIENKKLPDILKELNERFSMQFAMDGTPTTESKTFALDFQGSQRELLDRVAVAFDYAWAPGKGGIILLTKRFKDPNERPQLILSELRQTAKDMLKVLPPVEPDAEHEKWGPVLRDLVSSLTAAQVNMLKGGSQLTHADLSAAQQAGLTQVIDMRSYGPARGVWDKLSSQLENLEKSTIVCQQQANAGAVRFTNVYLIEKDRQGIKFETRLGQIVRGEQE